MPTITAMGGSRLNNAFDAARQFRKDRADAARQLKKDWEGWLYRNPPNIPLLVSNVFYLALCLTVLVLTLLVMPAVYKWFAPAAPSDGGVEDLPAPV